MTIKILKIDFSKGKRGHCGMCPVARGCQRVAKPLGYTAVILAAVADSAWAMFSWRKPCGESGAVMRELPPRARLAIAQFDAFPAIPRSHFEPFEFEIEDLPRCE